MSEAARHYAQNDSASRPQPGPLRDWLAAMKAATTPSSAEVSQNASAPPVAPQKPAPREATPSARAATRPAETVGEVRGAEATNQWIPRVVTPASTPASATQADISDLMAENIMLKAKLKVENDRYDVLQGVIARELRNLRAHVEDEMREIDDIRAERDRLAAGEDEALREIRDLRTQIVVRGEEAQREIRDLRSQIASREDESQRQIRDLHTQIAVRGDESQREIRDLRSQMATREDDSQRDMRDLRTQIAADAAALTEMRGERDLWAARADALAQPIFQKRNAS